MENLEIAAVLRELADLLEIQGASPFRIRAYRNAVRTLGGLTRPVKKMVDAGEDLTELPAVGKSVAKHVEELLTTGRITRMEEVTREIPRSLVELMRLDGVGPKKAKKLYDELDVETVDDLAAAVADGRVQALDGFGKRSAEKIARAIEDHRARTGRFLLSEAEKLIAGVLEHMEGAPGVERVEVAGSLRRRKETIGDIDLLASATGEGQAVVDHFVGYPGAERVEAQGPTKGNIVLHSGLSIDLRVLPPESFGAALQYFTGSKEHNVAMRTRAVRQGLRVNEWGVFRVPEGGEADGDEVDGEDGAEEAAGDGGSAVEEGASGTAGAGSAAPGTGPNAGERIAGDTEEGVYEAIGMAWVTPELRENRGEIELAATDDLPDLVELADIRGDLQMHSTWSDGKVSVEEMAQACRERGYEYLAITDHSQAMAMVGGLTPERALEQIAEVEEVRKRVDGIEILTSCEVDILRDGTLDLPDDILARLDLVVVSVHSYMDQDRKTMTDRVLRAIEHPDVDILAHPTGRQLGRRNPFELDVEAVLEAAADLGVAVELNANPRRLDLSDVHAYRARELGARVVISTDAHSPRELDNMRFGVDQARRGWLGPDDVLNTLSAADFAAWRRDRRGGAGG